MMKIKTIEQTEETSWTRAWFMSRVFVGFAIHVIMLVCAIGFTEHVVELSFLVKDHRMNPLITAAMTGASAFSAAMAGVYWVKAQYIRCCLPEVMDDATKKLNQ